MARSPIQRCAEWRRIDALARRSGDLPDESTVDRVTRALLRPGAEGRLRPIQVAALLAIVECMGLLGPIRVGAGKTLISFLAGTVLGALRPVLLVPAKLREKTIREYVAAHRTWLVHPRLLVDSYEMQSRADHARRLVEHDPDVLILDEAHRLKNPKAAVTRRVARYLRERAAAGRPVRVVVLSGTLIRGALRDACELSAWALGERSPMPRTWPAIEAWDYVLDQRRSPDEDVASEAGALLRWASSPRVSDVRDGVRRRIVESPGVIATYDRGPSCSLVVEAWTPPAPAVVTDAIAALDASGALPDGRDLEDPIRLAAAKNTLALGFWYRWRVEPPRRWLHARRLWAIFVRRVCARGELDSVEEVARACAAGAVEVPTCAALLSRLASERDGASAAEYHPSRWSVDLTARVDIQWRDVRPAFSPETEAVWLTDEIARAAVAWARDTGGIVWVRHAALGRVLDRLGVPYYGAQGEREGRPIEIADGPVAASIASSSEGRNLQRWAYSLHTDPRGGRASAAECEQMIARTHRDGQQADTVTVAVYLSHDHQRAAWDSTIRGAYYLERLTGQPQKLTIADQP